MIRMSSIALAHPTRGTIPSPAVARAGGKTIAVYGCERHPGVGR